MYEHLLSVASDIHSVSNLNAGHSRAGRVNERLECDYELASKNKYKCNKLGSLTVLLHMLTAEQELSHLQNQSSSILLIALRMPPP